MTELISASAPTSSGKFVPAPWQMEDLAKLSELQASANWSEMGCYKTSSVLWLADALLRHGKAPVENPSIMIVTTPSGKGTYYEAIPAILPDYTLIDVTTQGVFLLDDNQNRIKIDDRIPDKIEVPHVLLAHYHIFGKTNKGEPQRDKNKQVLKHPVTGKVIMKPWTMADYLIEREIDFLCLDEAHRIKNRDTKWTPMLKKIKATYRHVMTGTGFINRPDEIWSLLHFLDKHEWSSYWHFRDEFCDIDNSSGYEKIVGLKPEMVDEFRNVVRTVGVRRTLTEVMPHIKEPIFVRRDVDLSPTQQKMFDQLKTELRMLDKRNNPIDVPNILSMLNRCRQVCVAEPELVADYFDEKLQRRVTKIRLTEPSSKLDELMDIIDELQWDHEDKQQVVVFSNFRDPLTLLEARLEKAGGGYIHMRQSDNEKVRYDKWFHEFPKKEHQVFMATLQLGSESINLTSAHHVVFLDRSWSPKDNSQGIGRVRRPGQEGQPVVINIEARNTTDQKLENLNLTKQGWFNQIFGED